MLFDQPDQVFISTREEQEDHDQREQGEEAVSYTHLDVYKRQTLYKRQINVYNVPEKIEQKGG